jgi:hypothetical protein
MTVFLSFLSSDFATAVQREDHISCLLEALREGSSGNDNATVMGDIMCDITERATKKRKAEKAKKAEEEKAEKLEETVSFLTWLVDNGTWSSQITTVW